MDPLLSIEGEIRRLVLEGLRRKRTFSEIATDLTRLLDRAGFTTSSGGGHLRLLLEAEALQMYDWVGSRTMLSEERRMVTTLLQTAGVGYAQVGDRIRRDVLRAVERGLRQDLPAKDIESLVGHAMRTKRHVARTITRTALGGFDRANVVRQAFAAGVERFRYAGPVGERDFCRERVGKVYTLEQIQAMNNGQGLPVLLYCGGYNCRHSWIVEG